MINIKYFDPNLLTNRQKVIQKYLYIYILIGYLTIKYISDFENIHSVNPLYLIIGEVDGYIEEKNGIKYLDFGSTDKKKEVLIKYTKLWDKNKYLIKTINCGEKKNDNEKE